MLKKEAGMSAGTQLEPEMLKRQAETLQAIFETLPMGVMVADVEGKLLFVNPAAEQILGAGSSGLNTPDQTTVYGWYFSDQITLVSPEGFPLFRASRGEQVSDELFFVRHPSRPAGSVDLDERLPAERWRRAPFTGAWSSFRMSPSAARRSRPSPCCPAVVEQTADSVMLTDKQGTIEYVNPAFVTTSGYPVAEVLGATPRILKSGLHDAGFYSQLWSRLMGGQTFRGMIINRKKSGELYWAQQTITPVRDQGGELTHFVSVLQDITELRKQEEHDFQLRLAREVQQQFYGVRAGSGGFDIGGASYPAYETGGDYFDFIAMPNGRLGIALGDVEGHGFGSALVMALTRAYLRSFASLDLELDQILVQVNRMLVQDLEHGHFVTLALACLDTSRRSLIYAGAGHMPGFVLSSIGSRSSMSSKAMDRRWDFFPTAGFPARKRSCSNPGRLLSC